MTYKDKIKLLNELAKAYYVYDNPIATDEEYDKLYKEVVNYEHDHPNEVLPDSPTQRVGDRVAKGFETRKHIKRMWSMEDVFNKEGIDIWYDKLIKEHGMLDMISEPKFDGLSLNLLYENGLLVAATTRGDGEKGEDVLANAKQLYTIPLTIPYNGTIEIRGEVVMKTKDFDSLNKQREGNKEKLFANPRNAAAGSLRLHNPSEFKERKLTFYPWGFGYNTLKGNDAYRKLLGLNHWGFRVSELITFISSKEDIDKLYKKFIAVRIGLEFAIDGLAIKVRNIELQEEIGYTNKFPLWMAAYKLPPVEKVTKIVSITKQVGRTGVVTPVAEIVPTLIDGSLVQRVTLSNYEDIERKGYMIGDSVLLIKSGDVIPKLTKIFKDRRTGDEEEIHRPTKCPCCNTPLQVDGSFLKCPYRFCSGKIKAYLIHISSRDYLDIDGIGPATVDSLYDSGVRDIVDLIRLDMNSVTGLGNKTKQKIAKSIDDMKGIDLYRIIASLGIHTVGRTMGKKLALEFGLGIVDATYDELLLVEGIGDSVANAIVNYFKMESRIYDTNKEYVKLVLDLLNPKVPTKLIIEDNPLKGLIFVITGTFTRSRNELKALLESKGCRVSGSVTSKVDYLLCSEEKGKKFNKAKELKIPIINEDCLNEML